MFSLRRSSYHPIQEEDPHQLSGFEHQSSVAGEAVDPLGDDECAANCELPVAPAADHHPIIVSMFKCEKDPEMSSLKDDRTRWDHVRDVDQFFLFVYEYYQHKGFLCILLRYFFSLFRFAFVVFFSTFLLQCVDYDVLFYNRNVTLDGTPLPAKRRIQDAFIPQCQSRFNPFVSLALFLAILFWIVHAIRICCRLIRFFEIRHFFATQLQIHDVEMQNMTWNQVAKRLCQAQQRVHLIINRDTITPLDIYQRILRHKNYFVAFVYESILPPPIFFGRVHYLSSGLRFNLDWLLFWGRWSPWKASYALKEEFKDKDNLERIAQTMRHTVAIMSLVNLLCLPFVFVYQLLFSFFSYSELFQREPNSLGMRKYSNYGREKLRHFNEMDHELEARLNRSHEFAVRYTDQFVSPLAKIIAKSVAFVAAAIFVVLCALTAYDEDTLKIEHVTTLITVAGGVVLACRVFIPNEHLVFCQQLLMRQIVANIHYAPKSWLRNAHSTEVYAEFTQIFRLKAELLVEELLSPLLTPFILYFYIRPRVLDIVTFFHKHTVHVNGLGDVCSFAQMDLSRDGDARLASINQSMVVHGGGAEEALSSVKSRMDGGVACGKVELSLLNFATQNPDWAPSKESAEFIRNVKELVAREVSVATLTNHQAVDGVGDDQPQHTSSMDAQTLALLQASTHCSLRQMMEQSQRAVISDILPDSSMFYSSLAQQPHMAEQHQADALSRPFQVMDGAPQPLSASIRSTTQTAVCSSAESQNLRQRRHCEQQQQHEQQHVLLANSQMGASSFIQPSPLAAIVQPRVIQESNFRAMEMSMQALAINHLLLLNNTPQSIVDDRNPHHYPPPSMRFQLNRFRSGYGSILQGSVRRGPSGMVTDSLAESNIFGVPAGASQIHFSDGDSNLTDRIL